jgi:hypothetical protein
VLRIIAVVLVDTTYMIYSTPTTPSGPMIHALQILATHISHNIINLFYQEQKYSFLLILRLGHLQNLIAILMR